MLLKAFIILIQDIMLQQSEDYLDADGSQLSYNDSLLAEQKNQSQMMLFICLLRNFYFEIKAKTINYN